MKKHGSPNSTPVSPCWAQKKQKTKTNKTNKDLNGEKLISGQVNEKKDKKKHFLIISYFFFCFMIKNGS